MKSEKMMRRTGLTAIEAVGLAGLSKTPTAKQIYRQKISGHNPAPHCFNDLDVIREYRKGGWHVARRLLMRNPVQRFALAEAGFSARWAKVTRGHRIDPRLVRQFRMKSLRPLAPLVDGKEPPRITIPPNIIAEAHWDMGATGFSVTDIAILVGYGKNERLHVWSVAFDQNVFSNLYGFAEHFMAECVLQRVPPK